MAAYYNEFDPFAAAWLRELIKAGQIADGEVDERSIADVRPADLAGFTQCHFFAGIGGWSLALRLAGWRDDRAVWTGSCPCQPFSSAGAQAGGDDPRHLWPTWFGLIRECRPAIVFGEQVESAIGHGWFDLVCDDLEREGYATGAASLPACSVGAPHKRQRLWFVADSDVQRQQGERVRVFEGRQDAAGSEASRRGEVGALDDAERGRTERGAACQGCSESSTPRSREDEGRWLLQAVHPGATRGFWADAEWIWHRDGYYRAVEPGTFPLAARLSGDVGQIHAYGNAIVPQVAAAFIGAYLDVEHAQAGER